MSRYLATPFHWAGGRTAELISRALVALGGALATVAVSGCISQDHRCDWAFHTFVEEPAARWRDYVWAKRAFHQCYPTCHHAHPNDFEEGFIAGYSDICDGGKGVVPPMPPEEYWGQTYQSGHGASQIDAWYEGYPAGVTAARRDGAGAHNDVYVSRMMQTAMRNAGGYGGPPTLPATPLESPLTAPVPATDAPQSTDQADASFGTSGPPMPMIVQPTGWGPMQGAPGPMYPGN